MKRVSEAHSLEPDSKNSCPNVYAIRERKPLESQDDISRRAVFTGLVWAEPMLKVAARFGVSSSYMARVCALLNVPRPERGYWAKLDVGRAPQIPSLPEARPGDPSQWSKGRPPITTIRTLPRAPDIRKRTRVARSLSLTDRHGLIAEADKHFVEARLSNEVGYLKPNKRLLVDVVSTKPAL